MRRRSRAGGKSAKSQRHKAVTPKRRSAPESVGARGSSVTGQETEVARLTRELNEALEQQAATGELLKVISSSKFDLQLVLDTLLETAVRLCGADIGVIRRRDADSYPLAATFGYKPEWRTDSERYPGTPTRGSIFGRTVIERRTVHVPDVLQDPEFARADTQSLIGFRAALGVPLLREGNLIGIMAFQRFAPGDFTPKQIELVETFAAQAVIAIENARLLNELRESLDQQTATSEILRVIASTPEDSKRALDTIAETASRMFDSANVNLRRLEGNVLRVVSSAGPSVTKLREVLPDIPLETTDPAVRSVLDNRQIAVEDRLAALPNERGELARTLHDLAQRGLPIRSQAFTPLLREGKAIGVMIVSRGEVRPFQQYELELMRGFADQAVIAIENARLLNELRQRTDDLSESLEQQTATSEV